VSKKQWGHGYYNGVEDALKSGTPLADKPIYFLKDGRIHNQGSIIGVNETGDYLIQRYSFIDGGSTDIIMVLKSDMADVNKVRIYVNDYQWHKAYFEEMQRAGRLKGSVEEAVQYALRRAA